MTNLKVTHEIMQRALVLRKRGFTHREISQQLDLSLTTVANVLRAGSMDTYVDNLKKQNANKSSRHITNQELQVTLLLVSSQMAELAILLQHNADQKKSLLAKIIG